MKRVYSAAYLTFTPLNPPDAVRVAALNGYDAVGLRIMPAAPGGLFDDLIGNKAMLRETKAALKQTGISVFDVELARIGEGFDLSKFVGFLDVCGELGAKAVLVAGDDPDEARLTANYAAFCEAALPYNLTADLEFMPWTAVNDCRAAMRILGAAQQPNGGILVDALHVGRSTTSNGDLAAIPRKWLHYCQLCDAKPGLKFTLEELIHTARTERFLPGEKNTDIAGMLQALPADLPISVEIPSELRKRDLGVLEWCRLSLEASRKFGG